MNRFYQGFGSIFCWLIVIFLTGCATTYEAAKIDSNLNVAGYEKLNRAGNHEAVIKYNGQMSGDALVLGIYGSAHTYKYDFSPYLEDAIEQVLNKVYQSVKVNDGNSLETPSGVGIIRIEFAEPNVRLNCFIESQIKGNCVSVSKMTATVTTPMGDVREILIKEEEASQAQSLYQGGPKAISASVGASINSFSDQLYGILSSY